MRNITWIVLLALVLSACKSSKSLTRILKSPDPAYKLRMAEQFFVKKKYNKAQQVYEDVMPYYKTGKEFEDIYYKYAYCAYHQSDFLNAENLFKTFLEIFPNSNRAEEVDYMRAYCFYRQSPKPELDQTSTIRAMGMMQTFINTHPGSVRNKEAQAIIDEGRKKLEIKEFKGAQLYFDMGQFRAAGVAFTSLLNNYPDSERADEYKLMIIRSYYRFAEMSVDDKKAERYEKVIEECNDFTDRFPESRFRKESDQYLADCQRNIKTLNQ
jgi:outer membrane protein assembly factor BamD